MLTDLYGSYFGVKLSSNWGFITGGLGMNDETLPPFEWMILFNVSCTLDCMLYEVAQKLLVVSL